MSESQSWHRLDPTMSCYISALLPVLELFDAVENRSEWLILGNEEKCAALEHAADHLASDDLDGRWTLARALWQARFLTARGWAVYLKQNGLQFLRFTTPRAAAADLAYAPGGLMAVELVGAQLQRLKVRQVEGTLEYQGSLRPLLREFTVDD